MNGLGVDEDDDLANVRWPESTVVPYRTMGVLARTLRGRKFVWPEHEGGCYWTRCWSGEAALLPDSRHCDLTDSSEAARVNLELVADRRDGDVDLARSGRTALCWSTW
jgi:hypothetical protein